MLDILGTEIFFRKIFRRNFRVRQAQQWVRLAMLLRHAVFTNRLEADISAVNIYCYLAERQRKSVLSERSQPRMRTTEWIKTRELSVDAADY